MDALKNLGEAPFPLPKAEIHAAVQQGRVYLRIPLQTNEKIFGLGLNFKTMNQRGRVLNLHVDHYGGADNGRTHAPVPFYVSNKGYGVLVNSAQYITVYAGTGVRVDTKNPPAVHDRNTDSRWEAQPYSDAVEILVPASGADVYVFAGTTPLEVVQRYNLYNGGGVLPPKWGLGFTQRLPTLSTEQDVRQEVDAFAQHQFPLDFIGLEPGWQSGSYPCTFEWDKKRFPDPAGFTRSMLDKGIRLNLWLNPYVSPASSIYTAIKPFSGSHTVWNGLVPDLNTPDAPSILHSLFASRHMDIGISGYKIDEIDGFDKWLWPDIASFPSGLNGEQMRQVFGLQWQRMVAGWYKHRNKRTYSLARGSNAGASALPYVLYDDYYDHRDFITALCNSSFIGVLWTPEVRKSATAEEWLRRMQTVCFSPMAMINAWEDGTKPWTYPEVATQVQEAAKLRMQLFPYLYTCFARYRFEGIPPVRAMNLVEGFTDTADVRDEFMLGDNLLVAPLFAGEKTRKLVLPAGNWYDFYTGRYTGNGQVIDITPGIDRIPLYVRDGGVIPMIPPAQHTPLPGESFPVEIRVYGEKPGSFRLYDDDGETFDYEKGNYTWYTLHEGQPITHTGNFTPRQYSSFTWKFMSARRADRTTPTSDTTFLYVTPHPGQDPADGSIEHPFTSLEAARQAIQKIRSGLGGQLPTNGVTVRLRAGTYELPASFCLTPEDSGAEGSPVIYTAFPGETVILSGGKKIPVEKAKQFTPSIKVIDLQALGITDYGVHRITGFRRPYVNAAMELFVNGKPYHLARYPNDKNIMLDTGDVVDKGINHPGSILFNKQKLAQWSHAREIIAAGNFTHSWATDQLRVAATDPATGLVTFADPHPFGITGGKEWNQYFFFNLLEEIDQPGEYYIDHEKGKLYFYPLQPLRPRDTIQVSMLEDALVSLKGASHVQFRNIGFEAGRGIGIYMEHTVSDRIADCTIRNMGVVAVCIGHGSLPEKEHRLPDPFNPVCPNEKLSGRLGSVHELLYENTMFDRDGGKDNVVVGCRIENTGCGGISLGGGNRATLTPAGNLVENCEFTNCGRIDYSYKSPVNVDGVGNIIRHCLFNACPATAIYVHGNDHLIEYNEISEACNFVDDQGAIYLGRDPSESGNTIRWNFFKNTGHFGMTMAVYFDDGACGSQVYGNVFYKAGTRTIMVGGGSYNHIFNNIFIDSKMAFHLDDRLSNWSRHVLDTGGLFPFRLRQAGYDHPPFSTAYPWLPGYFRNHPEIPQHNDIENNVLVNVEQLHNGDAAWGPIHANNFITADDPGFADAAHLDFTVKQGSEIFKQLPGFTPIPFGTIGLIKVNAQPISAPKDDGWKRLSLRQKIGQLMLMLPDRELELQLGHGSLSGYFANYPVGGFFMGWKLWQGVRPENKLAHIQKMSREYQAASPLPLLFQEDYESGINIPGMTSFPNEMSLGAANSPELAYAYGATVAKECLSVGVKWVLHPVADLNLNPLNPITNVRSIGDDPDRAIRLLSRQIHGLQDNGVAATIKHFPGDGVDTRDQHLLTSCNSLPLDIWKQKHGKVFQALIDSGVACIMPGHITLPSYQTEKINGFYPPATLSRELLTGLLKGEMGFKGVIVSDAMTMGGFRGYYDELEGQVHSFLAGVDVLLWPSYRFMDTLEARIRRGEIPMARLDDAVQRVWALKERFGLLDRKRQLLLPLTPADKQQAEQTAAAICDEAITLVRDREHSLPLNIKKDKKILVVGVVPVGRKGGDAQLEAIKEFAQDLQQKGFEVDFRHNILFETQGWMDDAPSRYDRIIFVVARSPHAPFGPLQLWDDEAQSVWAVNALPKEKTIVISLGSPYLVNEYFQRVNTCINAYSNTPVMHRAVIRALMGEIPMKGVSPVNLGNYDPPAKNPGDPTDTLSIARECRPRAGLPNVFAKLRSGQPLTIAYLGGSITQATNGYREQSTAWLRQQYPTAEITAINAGVGGTRSDLGCFRLRSQVLDRHPDLVFVEFAVNDKDTDSASIHQTMEGIVRQIWKANARTDICFVYTMTADMAPVLSEGKLPAAARAMEDVAEYYHIPSVDMCLEIVRLSTAGKLVFKGKPEDFRDKMVFSADNVHPYPQTGHRLYTEALTRSLQEIAAINPTGPRLIPSPLSPNRLDNVQMIPADQLTRTGEWTTVTPDRNNAGALSPDPFPVLLKTAHPGSALVIKFNGTMVGLYDVIGPGTSTWDVILDGQPYQSVTRFDAFATYWRPHYVLLSDLPPGQHTVEFHLSANPPDKRSLLGANVSDYNANPQKYQEAAGYAGFLLLAGNLIK